MNFLAPYKALTAGALIGALVAGWFYLTNHYESQGYDRAVAEYTAKALVAEQAARAAEQAYQQQLKKAEDDFRKRQTTLDRDRRVAVDSANSLRDTIAALSGELPNLTAAACADQARASNVVLTQCVGAIETVAKDADDWHSEAMRIRDAWPTAR